MKNALILSGGGARAAYQVGVLKAVAEILPAGACNPFPIICGTSAGAINAVTLAAHEGCFADAVQELEGIWRSLEPGSVYRYGLREVLRGVVRMLGSLGNQGVGRTRPIALLDNSPLRELIERTVHFERIDRAIGRGDIDAVSVTAMGYTSGQSVAFFQGRRDLQGWQRHRRIGRPVLLNADHLMASSAIPTLFPTTRIEYEYFGDGALRQLAPISPALHLGADRVFIIGVSGNRAPKHGGGTRTRHSPSIAQIIGQMLTSAFVDTLEGDIEHLERINELVRLIPDEIRAAQGIPLKPVENLIIWPSEEVDKIAGRKVRYLPKSLRAFLRSTGATTSGGGAMAASYLLFAQPFIDEMINLGFRDTMWEAESIASFLAVK
ncbi:MAG: patatin-like phospholipase family protein [Halieaceae bacterium]|nr:patatin-like phospholipase family protein [Halieaceae bacterium]